MIGVGLFQKHICINLHKYNKIISVSSFFSESQGLECTPNTVESSHQTQGHFFSWVRICLWAAGLGEFGLQASLVFCLGAELRLDINSQCSF